MLPHWIGSWGESPVEVDEVGVSSRLGAKSKIGRQWCWEARGKIILLES